LENAEAVLDDAEVPLHDVIERNDGLFQFGIDDETACGPLASRRHAEQVALAHLGFQHRDTPPHRAARIRGFRVQTRHLPAWCRQ
jgi:hypothetical protein